MSVVLEFPEAPQFEFLIDLQGQSLYQKWLELGNVGTESDFLNWLKLDGDTLYEPIIGAKGTAFNKNFGTTSGTVAQGNDSRLSDSRNPLSGSANYIQNQSASAQSANMWISGQGLFGGNVGIGTNSPFTPLEIRASDPVQRFYVNGGTTDKRIFEIRAIGQSGFEGLQIRTVNDGNTVYNSLLDLSHSNGATFSSSVTAAGKLKALCPIYTNESSATVDSTLESGQFYKLTGSKIVYQK